MTVSIQPIERDDQFWVNISLDGRELEPRGPFSDKTKAEIMANQLAAFCRGLLHEPVHIGDAPTSRERHP